jgi:cytochrome c biogenesis protein
MNIIKNILYQRWTALLLILFFIAVSIIGLFVPQKIEYSQSAYTQWEQEYAIVAPTIEALQLNTIFSSYIFFVIIGISTITLIISLSRMFFIFRKQKVQFPNNRNSQTFSFKTIDNDILDSAISTAKQQGYTVASQDVSSMHFRKNNFAKYGSTILHCGFLLLIIAGIGTYTMQKRGFIQLIERDTFFGWESEFLTTENGKLADSFAPNVLLSLKTLIPRYYPSGNLESLESKVLVSRKGEKPESATLSINNPIDIDGVKMYQATSFGYTIGLKLERDGIAIPTYFSLNAVNKHHTEFRGASDFPASEYIVTMEYVLNNIPFLILSVEQDGKIISSGTLKQGESLTVNGETIKFFDSRQWTGVIFTENKFVSIAFTGFGFIILGLIFLYGFSFSEIVISVQQKEIGANVSIIGNAQREKAMFAEEFHDFATSLYLKKGAFNVRTDMVDV